ncbi:MAG: Gfo/Idh/MocA family oxidoreductase [Rhodobacterales bacterium]
MTLHIGIIGCGKQAEKHIMGLRANGVENITVADISAEAAKKLGQCMGVETAVSVEALMASETIGAVDICTPTPSHTPLILQAIAQGKHYLVEKPLATDLAEARAISDATKQARLVGMVGFTYRFAPALVAIKAVIDGGDLGPILSSTLRIGGRGSHAAWKHQTAMGGGAIREMLVHMIDLAVWYYGPIETVQVLACEQHYPRRTIGGKTIPVDAEDYVHVKLVSKAGQVITVLSDFTTPCFVQFAEVEGAGGMAFGSIQPQFTPFVWKSADGENYPAGKTELVMETRNIVADLTGNFLSAVKGKSPPRCSLADAVEVQRVLGLVIAQSQCRAKSNQTGGQREYSEQEFIAARG